MKMNIHREFKKKNENSIKQSKQKIPKKKTVHI